MNKELKRNHIYHGDALSVLETLPANTVDMVLTSPPYWGFRDYGTDGQLGLEPTVDAYIANLCAVFDEVYRVLKDEGSCWVNLGDTYFHTRTANDGQQAPQGIKNKSLALVPFRFGLEMGTRGWILRNVIIWHKPNCMPQSVKDRFTVDFEYLFFFTKQHQYWFDQQFEPQQDVEAYYREKLRRSRSYRLKAPYEHNCPIPNSALPGRNKRCVWSIHNKPFTDAHIAVYPEDLCTIPIQASSPEHVCNRCGSARKKQWHVCTTQNSTLSAEHDYTQRTLHFAPDVPHHAPVSELHYSDCGCQAGFHPGVVLDPFMGSGTTAVVARNLARAYVGIEINQGYIALAQKRLSQRTLWEVAHEEEVFSA